MRPAHSAHRFERHPRARVQAALVLIMPWNPRQEPAGEPEDLGDHRAVLGQQRDIPGHPVRVGPNDPTVAVEDGWPMSRLREEQMVRSTDVVNPIDPTGIRSSRGPSSTDAIRLWNAPSSSTG